MTEGPPPPPSDWAQPSFPTGPVVPEAEWRRLDPRMLLVHPVLELMKFLPVLIGIFVLGSGSGQWWQVAGVAIPVVIGLMRFLTTQFRVTSTQIELKRGLISTKILTARLDRVRAVELTSTPIHRILGLAKVEVGTASGGKLPDDKFALDSLPVAEAREMRVALLHRSDDAIQSTPDASPDGTVAPPPVPEQDLVLVRLDKGWVRYAPLTSSGNVIAAGLLAILGQFGESLGDQFFSHLEVFEWVTDSRLSEVLPVLIISAIVLFLLFGAVFSVLGYLVSNWDFTLSRDARGRSFHVRRGLLTSTETSLERERVRGLEVREPIGLRIAGAARLGAIVTGVSQGESSRSQLVPPAPRSVVDTAGAQVLEQSEPLHVALTQHGPAARRRRWFRAMLGAAIFPVSAIVLVSFTPASWWIVLPTLAFFPIAAALAVDRYRRLGHTLTEDYVVLRSGSLNGHRDMLQRTGIIGWNLQQSWFQRRAGLVTLVATTAAGSQAYAAMDIPEGLAVALADEAVPGLVAPFLATSAAT